MSKKIAIPVILVVVAAAGAYVWRQWNGEPGDRILISGNIELEEVNVAFKTSGKLIERTVDEGDRVERGQVIARLDRDLLLQQREQARAGLALARAQLAQAQSATRYQREANAAELSGRTAELGASQARLQELKTGARPEERREALAAVKAAEAEFERASRDWKRAQQLYKDDDISAQQYDQARARFASMESALHQARERLAVVETGPRTEVIEAQASQVERARAAVRGAEAGALEVQRREQEIAARKADVQRAQAQLNLIETQLEDTVASTPIAGTVLVKAADTGEVLAPGSTVVTIGDLERPWLRGYVNERDLGRVKLGSKARVMTDSYPDKVYEGRVTWISSEAEFTPRQIQTQDERVKLVYRVKISVDNPHQELKANMPADAEILLEQ